MDMQFFNTQSGWVFAGFILLIIAAFFIFVFSEIRKAAQGEGLPSDKDIATAMDAWAAENPAKPQRDCAHEFAPDPDAAKEHEHRIDAIVENISHATGVPVEHLQPAANPVEGNGYQPIAETNAGEPKPPTEREYRGCYELITAKQFFSSLEFYDVKLMAGGQIVYGNRSKRQVQALMRKHVANYADVKPKIKYLKTRIVLFNKADPVLIQGV